MAAALGQGKMAFEVHLPELVRPAGARSAGKAAGVPACPKATPWRRRIAVTVDGAGTSVSPRSASRRAILRPPQHGWSDRTARTEASIPFGVRRGPRPWPPRKVRQIHRARSSSAQPLVARLATDPETATQRRDIRSRLFRQHHKLQTQVHNRHLRPRHRTAPSLNNPWLNVSPMSPNRCYLCLQSIQP